MRPLARQLLRPGLTVLVMLAPLLALGIWQLERLAWKDGLLTAITNAEAAPAVNLPSDPPAFTKVSVAGVLRHEKFAYYGLEVRQTPAGSRMGAHLIVPLELPGGFSVLINRGWVPLGGATLIDQPAGPVRIAGYVRLADPPRWSAPADDFSARRFYTLDPAVIGATLGLPGMPPFVIVALGETPPEMFPGPARRLPRPTNNHLSYAIIWFSLAGILVIIFAIFVRKAMASRISSDDRI